MSEFITSLVLQYPIIEVELFVLFLRILLLTIYTPDDDDIIHYSFLFRDIRNICLLSIHSTLFLCEWKEWRH